MADNFGLKIGVEGEKAFKQALSDINQSFKVLGSEMQLVSSQFDKNDKSAAALTARNEVLNKEIDQQKDKVSTLRDALENAAASFGENDRRTQEWQIKLNKAEAELNGMLADCRAGLVDMVVTKSISRFARNTLTMLATIRELKQLGVDVYFERERIHSISGDGELMLTVLASFAQEESRSASENCKWRIRKKMEKGESVGFCGMYGYDFKNGVIKINKEQAAIVRQIFDWYISGLGMAKIAKKLNGQGVPAHLGGRWTAPRIGDLLCNEKLTGNALLQKFFTADHLTKKQKRNRGELPRYFVENVHPAIIDTATFDEARRIRLERATHFNTSDTSQNSYPFSGKIFCEQCGKHYKRKKAVDIWNWQCSTFLQEGKAFCPAKQVPEETLMAVTAEVLGLAVFDETVFKNKISEIRIPGANRLVFIFFDGRSVKREWKDRSRSESWTEEMKQAARERALLQRKGGATV